MGKYADEAAAAADDYRFVHQPDRHRFVLVHQGESGHHELGEAHYTLIGEEGIDFDHTEVDPSLRGTGLSGLLVRHALADPVVAGRELRASCWFVAGMLEEDPSPRSLR